MGHMEVKVEEMTDIERRYILNKMVKLPRGEVVSTIGGTTAQVSDLIHWTKLYKPFWITDLYKLNECWVEHRQKFRHKC